MGGFCGYLLTQKCIIMGYIIFKNSENGQSLSRFCEKSNMGPTDN